MVVISAGDKLVDQIGVLGTPVLYPPREINHHAKRLSAKFWLDLDKCERRGKESFRKDPSREVP